MISFKRYLSAAAVCSLALVMGLSAQIAFDQRVSDAEMAQKLSRITDRSSAGLIPVTKPDGSIVVDLQGRFKYAMLAQVDDKGRPVVGCVASLKEANSFFGRNLETGESLGNTGRRFDTPIFDAQQHGMSEGEFQFYKELIERYQEQLALNPSSATITIVNEDGPGEGFNDGTPASPEGGNNGTTLGQQRLNLFNAAAAIWGSFLDSTVNIEVGSSFDPLPCDPGSGVLGAASTTTLHGNFANAGFFNTWHHQALANKQAGGDLSAGNPDISATFNSTLNGNPGCLGGQRFYLGLDNATPGGTSNLLVVLLHEIGHGLGFADFIDADTGELFNGFPDVYTTHLFDRTTSKYWNNMTNAERVASARNNNNVVWDGKSTTIGSTALTNGRDPQGRIEVFTPSSFNGGSSIAHWNTRVSPNLLMEPFITLGLPLNLDLTRQHTRDVGWYRDSDGNATPDTITNVAPSGGSVLIGSQATINWTNNGGFNRNVAVELSLNGGTTYPTVLAANIANTGSFSFTVPNTPTAQAKVRIREVSFASPVGQSAADFQITATSPTETDAVVDFDGDGKTDVSIFRPAAGEWWYLRSSDMQTGAVAFGNSADKPAVVDYTGDGKADVAFWRPSTGEWFVVRSEDSTYFAFPFGANGDTPVPADYDGDNKADAAVFRASSNTWFILRSIDGGVTITGFGVAGDKPVVGDYDGDGKADIAIYRPSGGEWWYSRSSNGSVGALVFGTSTDRPVPGDYTGDGKDDIAFWRPSNGQWFILRSEDLLFYAFPFGLSTDVPTPGDYDGDGKTDAAVFRASNNTWFLLRSTSGFSAVGFGAAGDQPLPGALVR